MTNEIKITPFHAAIAHSKQVGVGVGKEARPERNMRKN